MLSTLHASVTQSYLILCDRMDCNLPGPSVPWEFPSKNARMGCHFLFQGIFLTQGKNSPPALKVDFTAQLEGKP